MSDAIVRYYVATDGDDTWTGGAPEPNSAKTDGPFATLTRARDAVRQLKLDSGLNGPVEVQVRDGTYRMSEPLRLSGGDSGTAEFPITYMAYPGERPVLSGGRPVTGWESYRDGIVRASVPAVGAGLWWFRQLFFNGERMIRARRPKYDRADPLYGGWAFIDEVIDPDDSNEVPNSVAFRYEVGVFPRRWSKPQQAEIFIIPGRSWISDIIPIREVDGEARTIRLCRPAGPTPNNLEVTTALAAGNRFYVENALEDLTEPGEWCLDADAGYLYFRPPAGDVDAGEVTAPAVDRLVQLIGSRHAPVTHVSFRRFTFTQTLASWPSPDSYYKMPNAAQCFYMKDTRDCAVEESLFDAVGGDAIRLQGYNERTTIAGNEIRGAGAYGIFVGSVQRGFARHDTLSGDVPSPTEWHRNLLDRDTVVGAWPKSGHHRIHNNHIHHVGYFEKHANGIAFYGVSAPEVVISNNLIHHTPRFGIGLMSGFGRVVIENNHMHHLSLETCDTGGITVNRWYTYDKDPELSRGIIVRFNLVTDVVGCGAYGEKMEPGGEVKAGGRIWTPYYSWAIYFDNAPMDVLVYGNVTARNTLGGIMISHYCRNVTVENNIFLDSGKSQVYLLLAGQMSNLRLTKNIFSYAGAEADFVRLNMGVDVELTQVLTEFDGNVLFHADGKEPTVDGLPGEAVERLGSAIRDAGDQTVAGWRALGFDEHSVIADPRFVDPTNDDYNLEPDSPALALGFEPIDMGRIGLKSGPAG